MYESFLNILNNGKNGGRILARESENGVVEILGKSGKIKLIQIIEL